MLIRWPYYFLAGTSVSEIKIKHTAHSNKSHWGIGGLGAGRCLKRSLSGWKYFNKNVCGRDLRSSHNSKQSVWISILKILTNAARCRGKNYKGTISQLLLLPCRAPIDFKDSPGLDHLCGSWTQARDGLKTGRKNIQARQKENFCRWILVQKSASSFWPTCANVAGINIIYS